MYKPGLRILQLVMKTPNQEADISSLDDMRWDLTPLIKSAIIVVITVHSYAVFCMSWPNAIGLSDVFLGEGRAVIKHPAVTALWHKGENQTDPSCSANLPG